jgi:hypothetical protein
MKPYVFELDENFKISILYVGKTGAGWNLANTAIISSWMAAGGELV